MPSLAFTDSTQYYNATAELYYDHENDHLPISETDWVKLRTLKIQKLIIVSFIAFEPHEITLPSFSDFPDITQLSIRYVTLKNGRLPPLPPHIIRLELWNTNIQILDTLPNWIQILELSNNTQLTSVVLPPRLTTFCALRQKHIRVLTLPPTIVFLRLVECRFERINRLSFNSINVGLNPAQFGINRRCDTPYPLFNNTQNTYSTPVEIFNQIQQVNRQLDEHDTSIFYRLREYVYKHSHTITQSSSQSPIIDALRLGSNPPRRFSEFIVESV